MLQAEECLACIGVMAYYDGRGEAMRTSSKLQNFHVPLSPRIYQILRGEAEQSKRPATEIAREAIEIYLVERQKETLRAEIAAYAVQSADSATDLDRDLERASAEHLLETVEESE
jgi:hypothetical protein